MTHFIGRRHFLSLACGSLAGYGWTAGYAGGHGDKPEAAWSDRNILLSSSNSSLAGVDALNRLRPEGIARTLHGYDPPVDLILKHKGYCNEGARRWLRGEEWWPPHTQGVAFRNNGFYVTTTDGKRIISGRFVNDPKFPNHYSHETPPTSLSGPYSHPGGIQTIGDIVAVPVYCGATSAEVRFYDPNLDLVECLPIEGTRAYCVGVTNTSRVNGKTRYVLAVGVSDAGDEIWFYEATARSIGECNWPSKPRIWCATDANREHWVNLLDPRSGPDKFWGGCRNSMSLLADDAGGLYLLVLYQKQDSEHTVHESESTEEIGQDEEMGQDFADLYRVYLDSGSVPEMKKVASVRLKRGRHHWCETRERAVVPPVLQCSPRWGASARVVDPTRLELAVAGFAITNPPREEIETERYK